MINSAPRSWSDPNNTVVLTTVTFEHIQCLHMMYAEVAWVLSTMTCTRPPFLQGGIDPPMKFSKRGGLAGL